MASLSGRLNEPVVVTAKENQFFPKAFVWRGERHVVQAVERCWTVSRRHWLGKVQQHLFRVRTREATYVLTQDLTRDTWRVAQIINQS